MNSNGWSVALGRNDLINKISITLLVMLIYKIGIYVTVPGIDREILSSFVGETSAMDLANLISGGAMAQFSIFALGVMPYITASIIVQLLSFDIVPVLSEWKRQGEYGQKKTKSLTLKLSVLFAILQGVGVTYGLNSFYPGIVKNDSFWGISIIGLLLMVGTIVLVLLGEFITKKGIGNGLSIIIFSSIMMSMPSVFTMYYELSLKGAGDNLLIEIIKAVGILIGLVLLLAFVVFVSKSERRVPVKHSSGNSAMYDGITKRNKSEVQNFLPFKLLGVGVIPVIFAVSVILVPTTLAEYNSGSEWSAWIMKWLAMDTITGGILYAAIIIFFSYFYTFMQLNPEKIANDLKMQNSFIPGLRPGKETEEYITSLLKKVTFAGAVVLAFIAVIPLIISSFIVLPAQVQLGGISLVIIVSVALDAVSRMAVYKNVVRYENVFSKERGEK